MTSLKEKIALNIRLSLANQNEVKSVDPEKYADIALSIIEDAGYEIVPKGNSNVYAYVLGLLEPSTKRDYYCKEWPWIHKYNIEESVRTLKLALGDKTYHD